VLLFSISIGILANDILLSAANASLLGSQGYPHIQEGLLMNRTFNEGYLFIVIGYFIYMLISAYLIDSHPIFYVVGLMIGMIAITVSEFFKEAWVQVTNSTAFLAVIGNYPAHTLIWNNMTTIILGTVAISLIAMYSKSRGGGPLG
jgi:hypothetical protein